MKTEKTKANFRISFDEQAGTVDISYFHPSPQSPRQYSWDVDKLTTSAGALDFIVQVSKKPWATDELVGALVRFLDQLLYLQGNYCGGGEDQGEKSESDLRKIVADESLRRSEMKEFNKWAEEKYGDEPMDFADLGSWEPKGASKIDDLDFLD